MGTTWRRGALLGALMGSIAGVLAGCPDQAPPPPGEGAPDAGIVDPPPEEVEITGPCEVGPSPLRRLTKREYNNTVRDLLGDTSQPANAFPEEGVAFGFNNNADVQTVSPVLIERYLLAAEELSQRAVQDLGKLVKCDPVKDGEEACARQFIESFGARAFRRPMVTADVEEFVDVFRAGRTGKDFKAGIAQVIAVMLVSPEFLYRIEYGEQVPEDAHIRQLDDWEIASRLSYFFWGTMPDAELFQAAASGQLSTEDEIATYARKMVMDSRTRGTMLDFHTQWLGIQRVQELAKDTTLFPEFTADIRSAMEQEAEALIEDLAWGGAGDFRTLMTSKHTFLNGPLATFYGVSGVTGPAFKRVDLADGRAAGVLSLGGLLAMHAHPNQASPVLRGKWVREQLLCMPVPPPPDNLVVAPPAPSPDATTRERFAQHRADPACSGCHNMMDPIGFGFSKFDTLGRYRETENGQAIDDSGELTSPDAGPFRGLPELAAKLADAPEAQGCFARNWFRYAQGRAEQSMDLCTVEALQQRFGEAGLRIRDLMVEITRTRPFRYRTVPAEN